MLSINNIKNIYLHVALSNNIYHTTLHRSRTYKWLPKLIYKVYKFSPKMILYHLQGFACGISAAEKIGQISINIYNLTKHKYNPKVASGKVGKYEF